MYQFILFIHIFAAITIVGLVLVQQGRGATMGAAFGSGASQTVFGSRGSGSFLFRVTISFLVIFFITSISLNYLVMHEYKIGQAYTLPIVPIAPRSMHNHPVPSESSRLKQNTNNTQSSELPEMPVRQ